MTTTSELCLLSLEDLAQLIAFREVSPVEATRAVLERVQRIDPQLNSYITVTADAALAAAVVAEREIAEGEYRGLLHGIPIGIKDLFATKGVRTTAGSKILADWVPGYDATVVRKLGEAGAITVGKLGMHEWAFGTTSDNVHFGAIHNPWNLEHVPGGSSGGSGAATAAGLAFATLGSDTGGSIRMPAAACGCVGLMPTYGRASLYGALPLSWQLDHPGPLTRTVRDAAIVLQAMSGFDPLDPATEDVAVPDMLEDIERGPQGLRIGVPKQRFWDNAEPEVLALVRKAISDLAAAGASVREIDWPRVDDYQGPMINIMFADAVAYHAENFPSRRADYGPQVAALLDAGLTFTAAQYAGALRMMQQERGGGADAILAGVDVLAVPTMPIAAPTIASTREADPAIHMASNTGPIDFTGQPAISVPCGLTAAGLPAGIMFVSRRWDEPSALWAGRAYEQVRGAWPNPPIG